MSAHKLFLLDAYALIFRAYYAFIRNPRITSKGMNTSAIFGFTMALDDVIKKEKPTHLAVVFDPPGPTFRHEMFEAYKAHRDETPEDIRAAVPYIKQILDGYNIPVIEVKGYEADDTIGTMARIASEKGFEVFMMTPDKDFAQLVTDKVKMFKPGRSGGGPEVLGIEEVKEKFGIEHPEQVIDILALMGDAADNIPGCPGVGEKTAAKLIAQFGSVDGLYANTDKLKGKQKENVIGNKEQVYVSRTLATIEQNVPVEFDEDALVLSAVNGDKLKALFDELEFRTLYTRILGQKKVAAPVQGLLFGAEDPLEEEDPMVIVDRGSIHTIKHRYYLMDNAQKRASLRAELSVQKEFCFDTETTSLDVQTAELVGLAFSFKNNEAYYVPFPIDQKEAQQLADEFKSVLQDKAILKIGQNIKYDIMVLKNYGIQVKGSFFDTMIAHYLLAPDQKHNLDELAINFLNYDTVKTEELIGKKGKKQGTMRDVLVETVKDYACEDADITWQLKQKMAPELVKNELNNLFEDMEMPLLGVLVSMESEGVSLDTEALKIYSVQLAEQILTLEKSILNLAGLSFNVSSPKQVGQVLFEELKIDEKAKKTKSGQYSTAEDVLQKLVSKHPIVEQILEYRGLKKLLSTYVDALPELVNPTSGKIHTSYNQAIAATGRLSSTNPNLQNIPIRDAAGRELRKAFVVSDSDYLFFSADYSQVELRLMAHLSQDKNMLEAFNNGEDIHASTAAKIYGIDVKDVDSDMRRKAKTANFGIIYGISAFGLAERLNIPRKEAKELIDGYFKNFSGVKAYMDLCITNARETGFVETIFKRRRYLPDINSRNGIVRGVAERNAINAPIQGSAADVIKLAMINIQRKMEAAGFQSKMVLQVHDELNFEVLKSEKEAVKKLVVHEMEHAVELSLPLSVECGFGDNWLEAH